MAKVIFLHLFVILFTGGVYLVPGDVLSPRGVYLVPGGGPGGSLCGPGGGCVVGGVLISFWFLKKFFLIVFLIFFWFFFWFFFDFFFYFFGDPQTPLPPPPNTPKPTPPNSPHPRKQTQAYGQRAAGTHPTGIHSCSPMQTLLCACLGWCHSQQHVDVHRWQHVWLSSSTIKIRRQPHTAVR